MRIKDFNTSSEDVLFDDTTLASMLPALKQEMEIKKSRLNNILSKKDSHENYLCITVARLSYAFAKEEYKTLFNEAEKRGLII